MLFRVIEFVITNSEKNSEITKSSKICENKLHTKILNR